MASSSKSEKLGLSLWAASDRPARLDFRQDNENLEEIVGGHIADAVLHLTADEKNYVKETYRILIYTGTGEEEVKNIAPFVPRAIFAMCAEAPPVMPRDDGKADVYWDFWTDQSAGKTTPYWGLGGVKMGDGRYVYRCSKQSEKNDRCILKLNEEGKHYVMLFLPQLG